MDLDLGNLWNNFAVQPLVFALNFLAIFLGGYGFAIVALTLIVRIIMLPLTVKQLKSSKAMQSLGPEIKALQAKYGKDKEKMLQEQMRLYKERGVNPMTGCLPMIVQMPVWFALYQALLQLSQTSEAFQGSFLWIRSLANPEGAPWLLGITMVVSQFVLQRMMTPKVMDEQQRRMNSMMMFMPLMFVFFAFTFPAGLLLYWLTSNIFSIVQQYFTTGWGALLPEGGLQAGLASLLPLGRTDQAVVPASDNSGHETATRSDPPKMPVSVSKDGIVTYFLEADKGKTSTGEEKSEKVLATAEATRRKKKRKRRR